MKPYISRASLELFVRVIRVVKKAMGQCTAQCKMLLFRARTIVRDSGNTELAHLKKKEERKKNIHFASSWFGTFVMLSCATGSVVGHKTLDDEWYIAIKAYKLTIFEI